MTYDQADAAARQLLGPTGGVRFAGAKWPKGIRWHVGQRILGSRNFGVVGVGPSWEAALEDARKQKEFVDAQDAEVQEEAKNG